MNLKRISNAAAAKLDYVTAIRQKCEFVGQRISRGSKRPQQAEALGAIGSKMGANWVPCAN